MLLYHRLTHLCSPSSTQLLLTTRSGIKTCFGHCTRESPADFEVDTVVVADKDISISSAEVVPLILNRELSYSAVGLVF